MSFYTYDAVVFLVLVLLYGCITTTLYSTQDEAEPHMVPTKLPFLEATIGILRGKAGYLVETKKKFPLPIFTLRMPFQRVYVVCANQFIHAVQSKAHAAAFVPTLLEFGILFSGMAKSAKKCLQAGYKNGNQFTASVHSYLLWGPTLQSATRLAMDRLISSMHSGFSSPDRVGLLETTQHQLTLAMTGAVYGPHNPFNDPAMEADWNVFQRGISHLVNSPFPWLTAPMSIFARNRLTRGFQRYFETGGYLEAFAMIPEMYNKSLMLGIRPDEAAKMEIATSLAMLSSGSITAFWLLLHILSKPTILRTCREELMALASTAPIRVVDTSLIKTNCPTIMAMFHETFRYHSSVVSVKKVAHNTTISDSFLLKKDALIMIPGPLVHHDPTIWGENADRFDHTRFLTECGQKKLSNTSAFRPFGAGATACPGRHFSTNIILTFVAIVVLGFDVEASESWTVPTVKNADMWNAMPKPDSDIPVFIRPKFTNKAERFKFVWGSEES
ncbi:unnamed protein product [Periconia digitata]|uniref:Cytochrome P450 n=1 Tax=Periconia digitata TaxID=1303443 RepID=A0A9W4UB09_9PLEO|nr:unnamed protein product [Periconia digitata]